VFGVDFDKQVAQATGPFLEELAAIRGLLVELLEIENRRDAEKTRREQRGEPT
jgi:hypothetical protein